MNVDEPPSPPPRPAPVAARSALPQYGQFVLVGLTGVVVNLIVFALALSALTGRPTTDLVGSLTHATSSSASTGADVLLASAVAFLVATLWNFVLNNAWTFRTRARLTHSSGRRLGLYYLVSLGSLGVNELVLYASLAVVAPLYGQAAGILAGSVVGFLGNRRITFATATVPATQTSPRDEGVVQSPGSSEEGRAHGTAASTPDRTGR
jgi:putative flippase GtrA